jgi:hypothetical protein
MNYDEETRIFHQGIDDYLEGACRSDNPYKDERGPIWERGRQYARTVPRFKEQRRDAIQEQFDAYDDDFVRYGL